MRSDDLMAVVDVLASGVLVGDGVVVLERQEIAALYKHSCAGSSASTQSLKPLFLRGKRRRFRDLMADSAWAEPWKLALPEAYHLLREGALRVSRSAGGPPLSAEAAWQAFAGERPARFARLYAAYRALREQGWVVKMGQTFGGHFVLYQGDPDYFHSQFCVLVRGLEDPQLPWLDAVREMRVAGQTAKEVMLGDVELLGAPETPACAARTDFCILLRWVLKHEQVGRERQPHSKLKRKLLDPALKQQHKQPQQAKTKKQKKQTQTQTPQPLT